MFTGTITPAQGVGNKVFYVSFKKDFEYEGVPMRNHYVEVKANSKQEAVDKLDEEFGDQWDLIYETGFDPEFYANGRFMILR